MKPYDRRWQKARLAYLKAHPLCVSCRDYGRIQEATVVDHIIPHTKGGPFWDSANWQPLCATCHNKHKQSEEKGGRGFRVGYDVNGNPLDQNDEWYQARKHQ